MSRGIYLPPLPKSKLEQKPSTSCSEGQAGPPCPSLPPAESQRKHIFLDSNYKRGASATRFRRDQAFEERVAGSGTVVLLLEQGRTSVRYIDLHPMRQVLGQVRKRRERGRERREGKLYMQMQMQKKKDKDETRSRQATGRCLLLSLSLSLSLFSFRTRIPEKHENIEKKMKRKRGKRERLC